jgi:MHS family proline/betaine transporter-like MFS transporter
MADAGHHLHSQGNGAGENGLTPDDVTIVDPSSLKRTVAAAAVGNAVEWFDYSIFAFLAVTLGKVFFPGSSSAQTLGAFAVFAAALAIRPIGGLFFGALGDRVGRQKVLAATMLTMAAGSFTIGLLPSYETFGIGASVLLLLTRLVQGFSTGGEYGGAMTFLAEHAPDRQRGRLTSWLEFGTLTGFVLGSGLVVTLTLVLGSSDLESWGWRIPFLVGGPLGLVGLYLRFKLGETPAFEQSSDEEDEPSQRDLRQQLRETVVDQRRPLLVCIGLVIVFNVADYMLLGYMPTYLTEELKVAQTTGLALVLVTMVLMLYPTLYVGRLSDRVGRRKIAAAGCIGFIVLAFPCFLLIEQASPGLILAGLLPLAVVLLAFTGTMPATLPSLFPTRVRYGALSIGFNVSVALFGGTTPLICQGLVQVTGSTLMPAAYLLLAAVVGGVAVYFMQDTAGEPLEGSTPTAVSEGEARELAERSA